jgi:hypothetical protein
VNVHTTSYERDVEPYCVVLDVRIKGSLVGCGARGVYRNLELKGGFSLRLSISYILKML